MATSRVALVTGSGKRRVGNAIARTLAEHGFRVALHYHHSAVEAGETVADLKARGTEAIALPADIASEPDVHRLVDQVIDQFGRIDVLVNAAAIWIRKPFEQVTADDVTRHYAINVLGTFLCSQRVGLQMVKRPEGGSIITMGDWAIERPYGGYSAYFPSKGAIPAMTRSLAVELAARNPNVRVNCIQPGPVMLPDDMSAAERDSVIRQTLVKREGQAEHVAQAVLFLVENDFVTGTCLTVDGGRTIYAGGG